MAEILHKDQYKAYVLQLLHVDIRQIELRTTATVDARRRSIQVVLFIFIISHKTLNRHPANQLSQEA